MKLGKQILSLLLAMAFLLGMPITAFANTATNSETLEVQSEKLTEEITSQPSESSQWNATATMISLPEPDVSYKLGVDNGLGDVFFFTGNAVLGSSNRLDTSLNVTKAVDVKLESVDGGYRLYFMNGDIKTYICIFQRSAGTAGMGKGTLELTTDIPFEVYTYDETAKTLFYTVDSSNSYWMGANGTYTSISVLNTSFITGDSISNVDMNQFPVRFYSVKLIEPENTEPLITEPEATGPEVTEPEVTEPEVTEPEVTEPGITDPTEIIIANGTCGESLIWELTDTGTLYISGTGVMTNYSTSQSPWYANREKINNVVIHNGVTTIGNYAFYQCKGIANIVFSDSVVTIGRGAFQNCTYLEKIELPEKLFTIDAYAFAYCTKLTEIQLPEGLNAIYGKAFYASGIRSITIPSTVRTLYNKCDDDRSSESYNYSAFAGADNLTHVIFAEGMLVIPDRALKNNTSVREVVIPETVTDLGSYAFYGCTSLTSTAFIPTGVTAIGAYSFYQCTGLRSLALPENVTVIGQYAFNKCTGLIEVVLPEYLVTLGKGAFQDCTYLEKIELPEKLFTIDAYAFAYCTKLTEIQLPEGLNAIYGKAFYASGIRSITIPSTVRTLYNKCDDDRSSESYNYSAFAGADNLTHVIFAEGMLVIPDRALKNNTTLRYVTIPDTVNNIGFNAVYGCADLSDIYFAGTETMWSAITIQSGNEMLSSAEVHYNHVHSFGDWSELTSAGCTTSGRLLRFCVCGIKEYKMISALGHSYEYGICTVCGDSVPSLHIVGASLTLGNVLYLNISIDSSGGTLDGCSMRIKIGDDSEYKTIARYTYDGKNYIFNAELPIHLLFENVKIEIIQGTQLIDTKIWTMDDYSVALRNDYASDTKMMALLDALCDYGAFTAYYADPTGYAPDAESVKTVNADTVKAYQYQVTEFTATNLKPAASLYLNDAANIRVKFNASAWGDNKLLINGEEVSVEIGEQYAVYMIANLIPQQWDDVYHIQVVNSEGKTVYAIDYSVLSYVYAALNSGTELKAGLNNMLKAMYLYNQAANAYVN